LNLPENKCLADGRPGLFQLQETTDELPGAKLRSENDGTDLVISKMSPLPGDVNIRNHYWRIDFSSISMQILKWLHIQWDQSVPSFFTEFAT
jgi:hypothetical protein